MFVILNTKRLIGLLTVPQNPEERFDVHATNNSNTSNNNLFFTTRTYFDVFVSSGGDLSAVWQC